MNASIIFHPGRYVRSLSEAEHHLAGHPDVRAGMRRGPDKARNAARLIIELCRRGYILDTFTALMLVTDLSRPLEDAAVRHLATKCVEKGLVVAESSRAEMSDRWDAGASEFGDDWLDEINTADESRTIRQLRFWGMRNQSMRTKLERGECVDLSGCRRHHLNRNVGDTVRRFYFVIPSDVWQNDVDYCDAETEGWIWSIGRRLYGDGIGEIHASFSNELYQNEQYHCLWLR